MNIAEIQLIKRLITTNPSVLLTEHINSCLFEFELCIILTTFGNNELLLNEIKNTVIPKVPANSMQDKKKTSPVYCFGTQIQLPPKSPQLLSDKPAHLTVILLVVKFSVPPHV
jgi:hypothetical protein